MAETEPSFPVLCIAKNGFLSAVKDRAALETCGQSALRSGYYSGLLLVDSEGDAWEVRSATKVGPIGPLGGWRLLKSRRIRMRLELSRCERFDLGALQERVCAAIEQLPAQWEVVEDIEQTKARVRRTESVPSVIELFVGQS
jgi:hypothetical protein